MEKLRDFVNRRNSVTLISGQNGLAVKKRFADAADARVECSVYALLEKTPLKTPKIVAKTEHELIFTYLPGENYVELLERQEAERRQDFAPWEALADWLYEFNRFTGLIMADMNLRNFVFDDEAGCAAGLDFEQCRQGEFEEMAAGLCAYTMLYSPEMSDFKKSISAHLQDYFAQKYACHPARIKSLTAMWVERIHSMRAAKHGAKAEQEKSVKIGAVILCGGKSLRMGFDKAELEYRGKTFLAVLCRELSGFSQRLISSGEGEYSAEGWVSVADKLHGRGPMAGLCSALESTDCDALFVVSCDMPLITAKFAQEICDRLHDGTDAVIPRTSDGICHPYCAVYRKSCAAAFDKLFLAQDNCILHALDTIKVSYLDMNERPELANINTPAEYECLSAGKIPPPNRRLIQKSKSR